MTVPIVLFQVFGNSGASFRVQGFSTEPSHFGHFLSFACIPWMIISGLSSKRNKMLFLYLNICLLLTFSITAYFSAFLVYFFWIINNLTLIKFHHVLFGLAFFTLSLFYIELDFTYVYQNVSFLLSYNNFIEGLQFSASLSDRFYSFWAPITGLLDSKIIFGRGIGGDYLILPEIVPREVYELISSVRSGEVGVSSFFGKIITWGGWPLMLAYIFIFFMLYQKADKKIRYFAFPVFINSLFSMGALVVPYIWMWLAILKNKNYD